MAGAGAMGAADYMSAGADVQNAWINTMNYFQSLKNQKTQNKYSKINLALQFMQQQYERELQQKMFEREDTAVQRRVADLKAAGLSPVLAAGSGANAGPVINTTTPQGEYHPTPMIPNYKLNFQGIAQSASLRAMTDAQEQLIRAQINGQEINQYLAVRMFPAQYAQMLANAERARAAAATQFYELNLAQRHGISTHPSTPGGVARDASTIIQNLIDRINRTEDNNPPSGGISNPMFNFTPPQE